MAAPQSKSLKDLSGTWNLNKTLSDSVEPALALQGISWMLRKAIAMASVSLTIRQYTAPPTPTADETSSSSPRSTEPQLYTHVDIEQVAAGLTGTTELRCLDYAFRDHSDWVFGQVKGRSRWIMATDIMGLSFTKDGKEDNDEEADKSKDTTNRSDDNKFLADGNWREGDEEKAGPKGETHMLSYVESEKGWTATQVWGFMDIEVDDGEGGRKLQRYYTRNIVVRNGAERATIRLVYDYVGE